MWQPHSAMLGQSHNLCLKRDHIAHFQFEMLITWKV